MLWTVTRCGRNIFYRLPTGAHWRQVLPVYGEAMPSGLKIVDLCIGSGAVAERGTTAVIHYRGFLNRGDPFRSSYDDGAPIIVRIGKRDVIAGLEISIVGMRVGGLRELRISPHLAYRNMAAAGIPPNAVLRFEVELLTFAARQKARDQPVLLGRSASSVQS